MLAAACAVGVAGTFAAPIGGKISSLLLPIPRGVAEAWTVTFVKHLVYKNQ